MIKKLHISIVSILMIGLMFSCSTSNDVASNRGIQKRKYNKGFYVEKGPKLGGSVKQEGQIENENVLVENTVEELVPVERKSSAPEVVYVEDEYQIEEAKPEVIEAVEKDITPKRAEEVTQLETVTSERVPLRNQLRKRVVKAVDNIKENVPQNMTRGSSTSGIMLILLVILAFILPPLAVLLYVGATRPFWIDLIFWLIAIGVGFALFGAGIAYLCGLLATIYALLVIFDIVG